MVLDNLASGNLDNLSPDVLASVIFVHGSILNSGIRSRMQRYMPEIIIHLAAQPSLLESKKAPIHDAKTNILATLQLIELANGARTKRFVFASTSAVESDWSPYFFETEQNTHTPMSPYGISKLTAEHYLLHLGRSVVILRLGNVFGPRQIPLGENQLVPRALNRIYGGDDFKVYNDGESIRDFVYVNDVANAFLLAATHRYDRGGIFNISSGKSHSVNEVLAILKKQSAFTKKWDDKHHHRSERGQIDMDNSLFIKEFGWQPQYTLEEGLKETVEWHKNR